jgi:hypothetical protein|uniref:Uncharacterized protein n=1 Tax=viral metagenome TaxID=1070528 RepID=A0A6C0LWX2_9ZZZZ
MNNIFKLHSIKLICGKNRNIYIKTNKKTSKLSKTKYIKYKGEYIKLNTFIKEYDKNNKKKGINHGKKNVIIINNINDIKDKKIRDLFNKTFKKNAKIYIYTDKKLSRGGAFKDDVSRNNDIVAPRNFDAIPTTHHHRSHSGVDNLIPYNLKIDYNNNYDDIITEILEIGKTKLFERINNLEYTIVVDGTTFVIRPFIDFAPYKKIFLYFYINTDQFNDNGIQKWIKMPLHLSLFLNDMIERFDRTRPPEIKCLTTGHIHITSDDKIGSFNISTLLDSTKFNSRTSATVSISTHTYLIAKNLEQAEHIIKTHREQIFKDWYYDSTTESETSTLKSTLYIPINNKWGPIHKSGDGNNTIILSSIQKQKIYECFNKLQYIISNILYILYKETGSDTNLKTNVSGIVMIDNYKLHSSDRVKPTYYLTYTQPTYPSNINIRYLHRDITKRKGLIYEKDLENASVNTGFCPGTKPHSAHSAPSARSHPLPPAPRSHPLPPAPRSHSPPRRSYPLPPAPRSHSPPRRLSSPRRLPSPHRAHSPLRVHSPLRNPPVHYSPRSRSPPVRRGEREIISHIRSRSPRPLNPPVRRRSRSRSRYYT